MRGGKRGDGREKGEMGRWGRGEEGKGAKWGEDRAMMSDMGKGAAKSARRVNKGTDPGLAMWRAVIRGRIKCARSGGTRGERDRKEQEECICRSPKSGDRHCMHADSRKEELCSAQAAFQKGVSGFDW